MSSYRVGACAESRAITCHGDACDRDILFRNELVRTVVLGEVPNSNAASTITSNDLTLVWVDDYIVDWRTMRIASLNRATPSLPYLNCAILRTCHHPFSLAVECDARDIASVTFERKEGVWICRFYIVEFDRVMASGGKEPFVRRDTEAIDLGVRVLDGSRANTREGFPKAGRTNVSKATNKWRA